MRSLGVPVKQHLCRPLRRLDMHASYLQTVSAVPTAEQGAAEKVRAPRAGTIGPGSAPARMWAPPGVACVLKDFNCLQGTRDRVHRCRGLVGCCPRWMAGTTPHTFQESSERPGGSRFASPFSTMKSWPRVFAGDLIFCSNFDLSRAVECRCQGPLSL